ncbi:MAG: hypothetical protein HY740_01480 [Chloroflexi bacterium]|nr:hypothetical protein [Chloroflexota bacterium]
MSDLADHLIFLYGESRGRVVMDHLRQILDRYRPLLHSNHAELSERDSVLITYGDQVQSTGMPPLRVLADFCRKHLTGVVNARVSRFLSEAFNGRGQRRSYFALLSVDIG